MPQPGDCPAREITDEEVKALTWKCSLHKMPLSMIKHMALQLAGGVMQQIIKDYNAREAPVPRRSQSDSFLKEMTRWITRQRP